MKMHKINRSILLAASAVVIGIVNGGSASAAQPPVPGATLSRAVSFADLSTSTPEGVAALYRRIRQAAESVCTPFESREMALKSQWRECMDNGVSRAVKSVNLPSLTAYANGQRGNSPLIVVASRAN
jgi:UrcA family protein